MVLQLVAPLIGGMARAAARAIIPRLVGLGWSGNKIYRFLPSLGIAKYHRTTFLDDVREFRDFLDLRSPTRALSRTEAFPRTLMAERYFKHPTKYKIYYKLTLFDSKTDKQLEQSVSMYTDNWRSKAGWESDFLDGFSEQYSFEGYEVDDVEMIHAVHQKNWAY